MNCCKGKSAPFPLLDPEDPTSIDAAINLARRLDLGYVNIFSGTCSEFSDTTDLVLDNVIIARGLAAQLPINLINSLRLKGNLNTY